MDVNAVFQPWQNFKENPIHVRVNLRHMRGIDEQDITFTKFFENGHIDVLQF